MKFFINFKLAHSVSHKKKENILILIFDFIFPAVEKFCGNNKSRAHYISLAVWEALYNSALHGGTAEFLEVRMGLAYQKRLIFLIKDNGNFYQKQAVKKAIRKKDLGKLRNFKLHEKSRGYGFEIIFESKPKIKILKGAMCLIWKKACDQ